MDSIPPHVQRQMDQAYGRPQRATNTVTFAGLANAHKIGDVFEDQPSTPPAAAAVASTSVGFLATVRKYLPF